MAVAPPLRWHADGAVSALEAAERLGRALADVAGPLEARLPAGWRIVKDRPMRVVVEGRLESPAGPTAAYAKLRRPTSTWARTRDRWRGPRGPLEGQVLLALAAAGVPVARPLAWTGDGADVLVLEAVAPAEDLAAWARRPRDRRERNDMAEAVGRLLRIAHEAGWTDRDLHRGNLLVSPGGPVLVDPGTRLPEGPLSPPRRVAALGVAAHGLGPDVRAGLAALRAYTGGDRAAARLWFPLVVVATRHVARSYRRGRARRAARTGRHFEVFEPCGPRSRAVRSLDAAPASWRELAAAWIGADPPGARPMKADGRVAAVRLPDVDAEVVLKRWPATWRDRLRVPRPIRAFRRAYALRVRGVACPEPLLAAAGPGGEGVCVTAFAGPADGREVLDLHRATLAREGAPAPFDALPWAERRAALHRLGRFLRRLHDAEVTHRDLKAPNLVAWRTPRGVSFALVDLDGARVRRTRVSWRRRARDLARLDASVGSPPVSRADRLRVLDGYYASFERAALGRRAFARRVARASARKRGPGGRPR